VFKSFWRNESGSTAIEYALIAGFLSVVIVGAVRSLGTNLNNNYFQKVANNLS
jgi:pilus assembly protein Flp/PilA